MFQKVSRKILILKNIAKCEFGFSNKYFFIPSMLYTSISYYIYYLLRVIRKIDADT